jgi:UDP-N-acetylglucosamine 4-epimerase
MTHYEKLKDQLAREPKIWLVTGAAGFIGSNLVESLLGLNQRVIGLDNFSTGHQRNLDEVRSLVGPAKWRGLSLVEGDIQYLEVCDEACRGVDYVLHQAALGSVPKSIERPVESNASNVTGFLNVLVAAQKNRVKRLVYATSSSVYGDDPDLPKKEEKIGNLLSPYAVTKYVNELYAGVFARCYGFSPVGLRYFNVFGPRQDPEGAYAAVIPKWITSMVKEEPIYINGDGETSRDFCFITNVVQANLLAATTEEAQALNQTFNVALNFRTSLNELYAMLRERLLPEHPYLREAKPIYRDFRPGDVRHSEADICKAARLLGYQPTHTVAEGLDAALEWYKRTVV